MQCVSFRLIHLNVWSHFDCEYGLGDGSEFAFLFVVEMIILQAAESVGVACVESRVCVSGFLEVARKARMHAMVCGDAPRGSRSMCR